MAATRPGRVASWWRQRRELTRKRPTMNITTSLGLAAAGLLATVLAGAPAAQAASPEWKTERGIVLECQGEAHGLRVWTSVYENQRYGNVVQVVIGDPDDGNGSSKSTESKFLVDGVVKASVKVDGKRALVEGAAERHGARTKVLRAVRRRRLPHQDPRLPPPAAAPTWASGTPGRTCPSSATPPSSTTSRSRRSRSSGDGAGMSAGDARRPGRTGCGCRRTSRRRGG